MENSIRESYQKINLSEGEKEIMLHRINEELSTGRKHRSYRKIAIAACLCFGIFAVSGTAYAAYRYMTASEVAVELNEPKLSKYFGKTQSDVKIQENDEYRAIYIGEVTGKNLSKAADEQNDNDDDSTAKIDENATYIVTALERKDGKPIVLDEPVIATPFVKGVRPWQYNIYFMENSGAVTMKKGNILYSLTSSGDIEVFADRGVYIAMTDNAPGADSYSFDEKTGEIAPVEEYKGMNFLFSVDLDKSKANREKADEILNHVLGENDESDTAGSDKDVFTEVSLDDKVYRWTQEEWETAHDKILSSATLTHKTEIAYKKDGSFTYKPHDKIFKNFTNTRNAFRIDANEVRWTPGEENIVFVETKQGKFREGPTTEMFSHPDILAPDQYIFFITFEKSDGKFIAREYQVDGLYEKYAFAYEGTTPIKEK